MNIMNDEKVALYAQISKQVIDDFNTYLFEEFGTTFGNRSNEIEKAINLMLDKSFYEVPVVDDDGKIIGEINYFSIIINSVDYLRGW